MSVTGKPDFSLHGAAKLLKLLYGIDGRLTPLPGERDQNFYVARNERDDLVLKIFSRNENFRFALAMAELMAFLKGNKVPVPDIVCSVKGERVPVYRDDKESGEYMVMLLSLIDGVPYASLNHYPGELNEAVGAALAQTDMLLAEYRDPLFERAMIWDIRNAPETITSRLPLLKDSTHISFCMKTLELWNEMVKPFDSQLRKSIIYNDANDYNIIVRPGCGGEYPTLSGFVDFGDALYSYTVADLAVAIAYIILDRDDPLMAALEVVRGYNRIMPLQPLEADILMILVRARLSMSITIAAGQQQERPQDDYLTVSQLPITRTLAAIEAVDTDLAAVMFREECGLPVNERFSRSEKYLAENGHMAFPVTGITPDDSRFMVLDLSVEGNIISGDPEMNDADRLSHRIRREMKEKGAMVAVGRWCEPRILYTSPLFSDSAFRERPDRSVHLGVDLFADAGHPLYSPFDGEVYIAQYNPDHLDYGNMIILKHPLPEGSNFYTLYGHLSASSVKGRCRGDKVSRGEEFAWIGEPGENGGWSPHLHFQLIGDMRRVEASFPGVCRPTETAGWKILSPDPNLVLNIPLSLFPDNLPPAEEVLSLRRKVTGRNLSIAYRKPVVMSRGWMQYMFDASGQKYLDAYNNVPHAGHCHPEITEAVCRQSALLATNTRYLSDAFNRYAELLISTFPDSLNRVFIVNSGSEANELAVRMARTYTGQSDLVVLEGAYHGNTTTMIDISPWKHNGKGGKGSPSWVHTLPLPDTFRGRMKSDDPYTVMDFGREAVEQLSELASAGRPVAAFIAESAPSVGGQIILPAGYLKEVYRHIRSMGGVAIADEVQTAFGRTGKSFYAFEQQGVVPDIVVLGKPVGNGYPIGVVVTTEKIAEAFDNGMEFFSTFGGNTVASVAGRKVLEITLRDNLRQHALETGNYLLGLLGQLKEQFPLIGDVGGSGLFIGVELVRSVETLEPAAGECSYIVNRLREKRILTGSDGLYGNILKIRPPMPFNREDAAVLCNRLESVIKEIRE
jgi:4-aminobutyrate aminotransferase-like enzyme/Ser/Thr protein kinase RdoA (MazF antagonist)